MMSQCLEVHQKLKEKKRKVHDKKIFFRIYYQKNPVVNQNFGPHPRPRHRRDLKIMW